MFLQGIAVSSRHCCLVLLESLNDILINQIKTCQHHIISIDINRIEYLLRHPDVDRTSVANHFRLGTGEPKEKKNMGDPRPSYLFPHPLKQWLCLELKTVFGGLDRLVTSSSFQCCLSCICALICGITFSVHAGQRKDATCRYIGRVCDA